LQLPGLTGALCTGEAAPLPGFSIESLDQVRDYLGRAVSPALFLRKLETLVQAAEAAPGAPLRTGTRSLGERLREAPSAPKSATFALDCALLDGLGQALNRPLWRLLSPASEVATPPLLPASAELLSLHDAGWDERCERAASSETQTFKLKIGLNFELELDRLHQLRKRAPEVRLRVDANGQLGNTPELWQERLVALAPLGLEFVEEPVPFALLGEPRPLPCPLALDESLVRLTPKSEALHAWLASGHLRALIIKPMLHGGLAAFADWIECAARHQIDLVVSHLFDGPIAMAMYRHLAIAHPLRELHTGLGQHSGLQLWPNRSSLTAPGLGIDAP
jgi:L-alanine-DL-glutamate epimerase-like enolase superfamily enzyme